MRNLNRYIFKISGVVALMFSAVAGFAQDAANQAAPAVKPGTEFVLDINTVLAIIAVLLVVVVAVLGYTLKNAMEVYKLKSDQEKGVKAGSEAAKTITMIAGFLLVSTLSANAQAADAAKEAVFGNSSLLRYLLIFIIFMEFVAIFAIIKWIRFFVGIEDLQTSKGNKGIMGWSFAGWWRKFNKIKPIKDEAEIDMGHSYDGIRELDNVLPPWFTWSFIGTIIFAIIYMWRFHASANPAPDQYQEFETSVAQAKIKQDAYIASKGEAVDENNVVMLGGSDVEAGQKLFTASCVACHGAKGEGGVGPNLTDDYWLHGGTIGDVFKVIKLGVVEKGMQSWKDVFSATQIAQLSSYIKSIHGTNPPGAKEPQGDAFKEEATPAPAVSPTEDSTQAATGAAPAADSAAAK